MSRTASGRVLALGALSLLLVDVWCHPQCLDFRAPFTPSEPLGFCSDYSSLGCCSVETDGILKIQYDYVMSKATEEERSRCGQMVKDITCQHCSPYAAHIYDAEGTSRARGFPGLCRGYCESYYDQCRNLTTLLYPRLKDRTILDSKDSFCRSVALSDADYCYPDLLQNPMLLRNLSNIQAGNAPAGCLCLEKIGKKLANPLWARHAGDNSKRLFVAEQRGRVYIYNTHTRKRIRSPFLDFSKKVVVDGHEGDERGFLGMAFHPSFSENGRFFVYYVMKTREDEAIPKELVGLASSFDTKVRVSELRVMGDNPNRADHQFERVILEVPQPHDNHNGGELFFGLDGYLYISVGDGGGSGDPMGAGQDRALLHGKMLRIDVDSEKPYGIPPDNPFVGVSGVRPEIYAYGLRNIWRCGLDKGYNRTDEPSGRVLCGDVGQNKFEEIDLLVKGGNYGWNSREGYECFDDETCGKIGTEVLPVHAYNHTTGKSVTGGVFYRGCENPSLNGQYIYGDYVSSRLFSLVESEGQWTNKEVNLCGPSLCQGWLVGEMKDYVLSFGEDEDGEIYLLTSKSSSSSKTDGAIFKVVDPITRDDPSKCSKDLTMPTYARAPKRRKHRYGKDRLTRKRKVARKTFMSQMGNSTSTMTRPKSQRPSSFSRYWRLKQRTKRRRQMKRLCRKNFEAANDEKLSPGEEDRREICQSYFAKKKRRTSRRRGRKYVKDATALEQTIN